VRLAHPVSGERAARRRRGHPRKSRESRPVQAGRRPAVHALRPGGQPHPGGHLDLGWDEIDVYWVDCDDETAKRINLVDNRSADLGEYDSRALADLLRSLEGDYTATGYDGDYLSELLEQMANEALDRDGEGEDDGDDDGAETDAGTLLALTDVSVAEPRHQPTHGSRWQVGRHLLIVAKLADEHHLWRDELDGRVFAPYPEPYLTVSEAQEVPLLLVQPNTYLAGHLLDKHEAIYPGTVEKLS
jgi:hypothetical protein